MGGGGWGVTPSFFYFYVNLFPILSLNFLPIYMHIQGPVFKKSRTNLVFSQILGGVPDFWGNKIFPGVTSHAYLFPIFSFTILLIYKKIYGPVFEKSPKNIDFGPILRVFFDFWGNENKFRKSGSATVH